VQKSIIYIPKSVKKERMMENAEVFDFVIDDADMDMLDALTTRETLETFKELYIKCVTRDTPLAGTDEAKKMTKTDITVG
jgi:diketogulonate reductase-like aldo/keto reductase